MLHITPGSHSALDNTGSNSLSRRSKKLEKFYADRRLGRKTVIGVEEAKCRFA